MSSDGVSESYLTSLIYGEPQPTASCSAKPWVISGVALLVIGVAGAVLAYYFNPTFHNFVNQAALDISKFVTTSQLSTQQSLLMITLPVAGAALITGLTIHIVRSHKEKVQSHERLPISQEEPRLIDTLKEMAPTKKQMMTTGIVLATLLLIGSAAYAVIHWVPVVNQWVTGQALPQLQPLLNHQFVFWQSALYFGAGTAALAVITGLGSTAIRSCKERQEATKFLTDYQVKQFPAGK